MIVLGIETSCDETAAAVVSGCGDRGTVLASVVRAQIAEHSPYGGVVPEIAARAHVSLLDRAITEAMRRAGVDYGDLDAVAATAGPGLIGGLVVGVTTAKAVAIAAGKPFLAINHLEGHALTARLTDGIAFPYLLLLVSGGHTQLLLVRGVGVYERIGTTIDDAVGEAFDKTAKLLGLGFPGGPAVERAAEGGDPTRFTLPRPLLDRPGLDFSFAGLKTAVRLAAERAAPLDSAAVADLCASFQATVAEILGRRAADALVRFETATGGAPAVLVAAGGVAANAAIRTALGTAATAAGARLVLPPLALCGDNAAMIAWAAIEHLACRGVATADRGRGEAGRRDEAAADPLRAGAGPTVGDPLDFAPRARWPLDAAAAPRLGSGRLGAKA